MTFLILTPAVLSLLVLAAHFFRAGSLIAVGVCFLAIVLLLIPRRWCTRIVQALLVLGTVEWLRATYFFVGERAAYGLPWTRLAIILGAVAGFTALSALLLNARPTAGTATRRSASDLPAAGDEIVCTPSSERCRHSPARMSHDRNAARPQHPARPELRTKCVFQNGKLWEFLGHRSSRPRP
jgi:hypothetical protein